MNRVKHYGFWMLMAMLLWLAEAWPTILAWWNRP